MGRNLNLQCHKYSMAQRTGNLNTIALLESSNKYDIRELAKSVQFTAVLIRTLESNQKRFLRKTEFLNTKWMVNPYQVE